MPESQQYVMLPATPGDVAGEAAAKALVGSFQPSAFAPSATDVVLPGAAAITIRVVDTVPGTGAKLLDMPSGSKEELEARYPGIRLEPVRYYQAAIAPRPLPVNGFKAESVPGAPGVVVTLKSSRDGSPVPQAIVAAFSDYANRKGTFRFTSSSGQASFDDLAPGVTLDRLVVYPPATGFWGYAQAAATLNADVQINLPAVDLGFTDALRHFYSNTPGSAGRNVTVGVLDSGIAPHQDLTVSGGANTVTGESPSDFGDNGGDGHGTHVAGIIAGHGTPPNGMRGVAPATQLRSYRVFGQLSKDASSFAIAKAVDLAVSDGCDIINMSLGGGDADPTITLAINNAVSKGVLVVVASGNDSQPGQRASVSFPANCGAAVAVSAMGRKGTVPTFALETTDVAQPFGQDQDNFVAVFANTGPQISVIAPGDGIVSTLPNNAYGPKDGTSMACPVISGCAAVLLGSRPDILHATRSVDRSNAIRDLLFSAAVPLGFGANFEGRGQPKVG